MTENFGIAAAEAAACGTAVVVSDQCGVAEWLPAGVDVVPYGDVDRLMVALYRLLADPARRRELAGAGRTAAASLTWDRVAERQVELYEETLCERIDAGNDRPSGDPPSGNGSTR